jgi:copper(I)-binding protein/uncharacterized protein YcnI
VNPPRRTGAAIRSTFRRKIEMHMSIMRFAAIAALFTAGASPAFAHATVSPKQVAPGYAKIVINISHGCDGQATKSVRVEIPEGFAAAKPMPKAGWTIEIEKGDYAHPYEMHGKSVSSGTTAITWKGDLPDDYFDEFSINGMFAGVKEGDRLFFKTVQICDTGKLAWTEEAAPGQNPHELAHPAPFVTIARGSGQAMGHDHAMGGMNMGGMDMGEHAAAAAGDIQIKDAHARAMLPGQPTGAGYMTIVNGGKEADKRVSIASPAAGKVELHEMKMDGNLMKMRAVKGGLDIPAGGSVELEPGSYHLMFMDVKKPFAKGDSVPVTLEFEKAGKVDVTLPVGPASGGMGHMHHE